MARLLTYYKEKVVQSLVEKFNYNNMMEVPRITKIVINIGVGEAALDKKKIEFPYQELMSISGQKPIICLSKKAIAAFKLRENMPIGCKVTLRKDRMYEFLDRLISVSLPRTRDFRGVNAKGFDGRGNFTFGVKEHIIFPEIDIDKVNKILGMDITFVTTADTNDEAHALLKEFGFPFTKKS